jgi:hypothetical protein
MNLSRMVSRLYVSKKKIVTYAVSAFVAGLVLGALLLNLPSFNGPKPAFQQSISLLSNNIGKGAFSATLPELNLQINVTQYPLPVNLNEVEYYGDLQNWLQITPQQQSLLSQNGFVVLRVNGFGTLSDFYNYSYETGMPILVTTDAVLHTYHVLFDETLKEIETNEFIGELNTTLKALVSQAQVQAQSMEGTPLENAAKLDLTYLEVALALMQPSFAPTAATAQEELRLISSHSTMTSSPIFGYDEDYTQYVPRGHYTESEQLEAYFKTMMWLGRMHFELLLTQLDVDVEQTMAATLLTWMVTGNESIYDVWQKIYATTSFFVGVSDDLTFQDYLTVLSQEGITTPQQLTNDNAVVNVAKELLSRNRSKILNDPIVAYSLQQALNETAGLRFLGQSFIPDSYIFQQLVYTQLPTRLLPKGLDIPSVFGSGLAEQILSKTEAAYEGYTQQIQKLRTEFAALDPANWTQNLYWTWLYAANTTLANVPSGASYPTFMTAPAWSYEKLQTFEGTWTELRHDTILYAKQSYTVYSAIPSPPLGAAYVEPYPETYRIVIGLVNMTLNGLIQLGIFPPQMNLTGPIVWTTLAQHSLASFMHDSELFLNASTIELEGKTLDAELQSQIREAAKAISAIGSLEGDQTQKAAMVADVHTDPNTQTVLEEALGNFSILVAVYSDADGQLYSAAGPVYNYYEFTMPMDNRLTDEGWRAMIATNQTPQPPEWTTNFAR